MSPVGVGASRFASALETGAAKLWVLLIGVDRYIDPALPSLRYAAVDCQGIGDALATATQTFPHQEFLIHHDLVAQTPTLARVESSLHRIVTEAQVQDTVLIYFSGHGVVAPTTQQTILCVRDTVQEKLLSTGLPIQSLLEMLGNCAAHSQLLWLDACHSGNLNFSRPTAPPEDVCGETTHLNPTTQLLASLRHQAMHSRGFYALLSCDEGQQSWEFPDLGHGVFSYYLMLGLRGEAADEQGVIDADSLYRYVYRQTLQYIDRANQQLRLADRENRDRGELSWCPEYSAQTPKRIVSGVGEIILGLKPQHNSVLFDRSALIVAAGTDRFAPTIDLNGTQTDDPLSLVLQQEGKFTLDYFPNPTAAEPLAGETEARLRQRIHTFLAENHDGGIGAISTRLLYLRGQITELDGDAWFLLGNGGKLSRAWLRQELHRANHIQQIIILDCPGANAAADWVEALKITEDRSQCIIACAAGAEDADLFAQVLLEVLISAPPQIGVPVASLFTRLETNLAELGIPCYFWLSGTQGLIEILPATAGADLVELAAADVPAEFELPTATQPEITFGQDYTEFQPQPESAITTLSAQVQPPPETKITTISAPNLTGFRQRLESILARLVGPIAPALIDRVSRQSPGADPDTLVKNLLPLLPAPARAEFEQQVGTLIESLPVTTSISRFDAPVEHDERAVASLTPSAKTIPPSVITEPQSHFSPSARGEIEQTLKEIIGPVAGVLLGQIAPTAWTTDRSLLAALNPYLNPHQIEEFAQRLEPILQSARMTSAESAPQNATGRGLELAPPAAIDDRFTIACEQALTLAIGPIAKFIITTTQKNNPHLSPADLVQVLATKIPDPVQAEAFRRQINIH